MIVGLACEIVGYIFRILSNRVDPYKCALPSLLLPAVGCAWLGLRAVCCAASSAPPLRRKGCSVSALQPL